MRHNISLCTVALFTAFCGLAPNAMALPSYARQTGLPCSGCHTTPPELNAAGRLFKLMGYIDRAKGTDITSEPSSRNAGLKLLSSLPLGVMLETSLSGTKTPQPTTQNWNFEFPQDISLFLAGAWADHLGSFLQVTYSAQDDHFGMDNTDIRYANKRLFDGKELVYGITLNNNPTIEDLWNSTPGWGYPFIASDSALNPTAKPIIDGALGQDVAGIGGYTMWNQHLYAVATIYRSDHIGSSQPTNGGCGASYNNSGCALPYNIRGVAPYWRVAWQQNGAKDNLEIGAYGIHMQSTPGVVTGPEDGYTDFGPDVQYDLTIHRKDVLSLRGSFVRENSSLVASDANGAANQVAHHLNSENANAEYHLGNHYSGAFGWFMTTGTTDPLFYSQSSVTGSANGSPRSAGYSANLSYWPLQNVDLALQYTGYTRFNGAANDYDGVGRNASDNNTVYLLARFLF